MKNRFSLIIPVYNEESIIEKSITQLYQNLNKTFNKESYEILVCENGSTDETGKILTNLSPKIKNLKILNLKKKSYGQAIKKGVIKAKYKRIVIVNADYYDIQFIKRSVKLLDSKFDLIIGSKCHPSSVDKRPFFRRWLTKSFNTVLRLFFATSITDTHGLKTFSKNSTIMKIMNSSQISDELFDTELVIKAYKKGVKIKELPVIVEELRPTRYNFFQRAYISLKEFIILFINLKIKT